MLDENEFKPFTLNDFSTTDDTSETSEGTSASKEISAIYTELSDKESSDQISSFRPLTFEEEEVSEDFLLKKSIGSQEIKTDAEKIQLSEEFKNSEFFLENSLLTNAEEFAETIREGAQLHKAQLLKQIEEQANDTDRIHQKTVAENQAAEQNRKRLLSETEKEIQEIKNKGYKEGFEEGRIKGMQQRYEEAEPLSQQANKILEQLDILRKVVRFQAEEELVKLAIEISKNIVTEEIKLNQDVIKNIVQAALHETEVQGKIFLYLHPDDYQFLLKSKTELERYISEEQNLIIRQNPEMQPGSINIESDEEIISRSIMEQFNLIEDNLNKKIEIRKTHLNEVDIDGHDFKIKPLKDSNKGNLESDDYKDLRNSDESLNQNLKEEETTDEEDVEREKNDDDILKYVSDHNFKKEDPVLEDQALNTENNSLKETDADSNEKKHSEESFSQVKKIPTEQKNQSPLTNDTGINTETAQTDEISSDSS